MANKYCTKCGSPISEGASFCTKCGAKVAVQKDLKSTKNYVPHIVSAFFFLAGLGALMSGSLVGVLCMFLIGLVALPVKKWQLFLSTKLRLNKFAKIGISVVIFIIFGALISITEPVESVKTNAGAPSSSVDQNISTYSYNSYEAASSYIENSSDESSLSSSSDSSLSSTSSSSSYFASSSSEVTPSTQDQEESESSAASDTNSSPSSVFTSSSLPESLPSTNSDNGDINDYVLNKNSKKFHYEWCSSVDKMKESNKIYFTGTRDQVIAKGYDPCKNCNP